MQAEFKTLEIWVDSSFLSVTQINDHNHEGTYQAVWRKSVFDALRLFSIRRKYRLARLLWLISSNQNTWQFMLITDVSTRASLRIGFAMSGKEP